MTLGSKGFRHTTGVLGLEKEHSLYWESLGNWSRIGIWSKGHCGVDCGIKCFVDLKAGKAERILFEW